MQPTDSQEPSSSTPPSTRRISIFSRRRDQVHSATPELEAFQRQVAERFQELSAVEPMELLSISWIRKLLDAFISSLDQFLAIVLNNPAEIKKPPMYKSISELFDGGLKALDICNAMREGIEQMRQWMKSLEIVLQALDTDTQKSIRQGQFRRAKKALVPLTEAMLGEKQKESPKSLVNFRTWSVSSSWSAANQLQAIGSNLTAPRRNENGLNMAVFTMKYVVVFVMWVLVAAIPCQGRVLVQTKFHVARKFVWAGPILSLHGRILVESKRGDRSNACGLLKEILEIERFTMCMNELTEEKEKEKEVRERVEEVRQVYEGLKEELDPLERQIKEVFGMIVKIWREGDDMMDAPLLSELSDVEHIRA